MEILEDPNVEHKKTTFPYIELTVQLPDKIEQTQKIIDDYTDLLSKIHEPNDVLTEQKKQRDIEKLVDDVLKKPITTNDYWWEEDIFSKDDNQSMIDATKTIVDDIKTNDIDLKALSDNILRNLRPIDDRSIQQLIDDDFIPMDDRTLQEREDDDNISLADDEDATSAQDQNKTEIEKPYQKPAEKIDGDILDEITVLEPGKNAQIAAKKISQKY